MLALIGAAIPLRLDAAVVTGVSIDHQETVTELRFAVEGRSLGWHLTTHGQQLWIDVSHVRMELPHPLVSDVVPPITSIEAIGGGAGAARIIVEVSGREDYAIARLPRELVLRLAPVGTVADLAAPLMMHSEPMRAAHRQPQRMEQTATAERTVSGYQSYVPSRGNPQSAPELPATASTSSRTQTVEQSAPKARNSELATLSYGQSPQSFSIPATLTPPSAEQVPAPLVVIDPGHGGYDPGTAASDGTREKDLALAIALRVAAALKAEGIHAELTRANDTFLSLAERTAIANQAGADLFVSIHLNSSPDPDVSGIETYYLNNTTDRATIRLAQMENGVSGGYSLSGRPNLNYILTDMRQQYKANEAVSLARMIEDETASTMDTSMGIRLNALGAMQGPFYVLVGAMMPAVLVECGFLSNDVEAHLLETPAYQQALANGIARAVAGYFKSGAPVGNL